MNSAALRIIEHIPWHISADVFLGLFLGVEFLSLSAFFITLSMIIPLKLNAKSWVPQLHFLGIICIYINDLHIDMAAEPKPFHSSFHHPFLHGQLGFVKLKGLSTSGRPWKISKLVCSKKTGEVQRQRYQNSSGNIEPGGTRY